MPATNEQNLTFRIGIFVLASIVLLAILITLFGGSGSLFIYSPDTGLHAPPNLPGSILSIKQTVLGWCMWRFR